jgi:hypothetical protein
MAGIFAEIVSEVSESNTEAVDPSEFGARRGLDRNRPSDVLQQQMKMENIDLAEGPDGLPSPVLNSKSQPLAPALSVETLICMADRSSYVIRERFGLISKTYAPDEVERLPDGNWYVKKRVHGDKVARLLVEPVRKQCKFYARQMTDLQGESEKMMERLCTCRRDSSGEFLSLRDSCMFACELREPPHIASVEDQIEKFDAEKIRLGQERLQQEESFDLELHLQKANEEQS